MKVSVFIAMFRHIAFDQVSEYVRSVGVEVVREPAVLCRGRYCKPARMRMG